MTEQSLKHNLRYSRTSSDSHRSSHSRASRHSGEQGESRSERGQPGLGRNPENKGNPVTDHLDLWSGTYIKKATTGRGRNGKLSAYGIQKLRELILELAVRGKLVPQSANDESASMLLEEIAKEKTRLIKEGKVKKQKPLPEIDNKEIPFELPESWAWQRVVNVFYPISVSKNKVKTSEVQEHGNVPVVDQGQSFIAGYVNDEELEIKLPGPVIVFGDHTSALKYIDFNFVAGADGVKILRPICCDEKYFHLAAMTLPIENRGYGRHYSRLIDNLFPLPPFVEQHRIVTKVDELMALCDQLEQQQTESTAAHQTLVEILLRTLTSVDSKQDFAGSWNRVANHFDTLFITEHSVDQLKQTILQLAVMGKLVPQDPNDEPASVLLEKIAKEKARLVKEGKIRKQKSLSIITEQSLPFERPGRWEFVRFENIVDITSGVTKGRKLAGRILISVSYLRVANVQRGFLNLDVMKEISIPKDEIERFSVADGDLLITEGGDWDKVGRTTIWRGELPLVIHQNHVFKARRILNEQNVAWLEKYLNSLVAREYFAKSSKQTTNLASINKTQLRGCIIAIPPLAEQQRIVAKVDELMALCDCLKAHLQDAQATQTHLADAIVEQAIA